jgi:hypothetical protein
LKKQTYITVASGAVSAASNVTISSEGKYTDGTGYVYACIPSMQGLSGQVYRSEMYLATLYGTDRSYYNVAYNYGTYGSKSDGHNDQYPVYISGTKVTNGAWSVKKPSIAGVRQLHSSSSKPVIITQVLSASTAVSIHSKIESAIEASVKKGDRSFTYLAPGLPWRNHWTLAATGNRIYSRTYLSREDLLADSESGSNFSTFESDYLVTESGRAFLQNKLKSAVATAGVGTRDAVVAAAKFLAVAFPYDVNYVSGFGGAYYDGEIAVPNTSYSKFNHLDGLNIESETTSWGSMDNALYQTNQNRVENPAKLHGLNCSSFIYWAMFNGGFELYQDMANMLAYFSTAGSDFTQNIVKVNASYLGHGIGGSKANKENSFELTGRTGVADSYYPTWNDAIQALKTSIKPGDLVSRGTHHIGMVLDVTDEYIYTVDTFERQNDYALCYNGYTENKSHTCKDRTYSKNPDLLHHGLYIRKFATDHSQNYWDKVISMDYVYNDSTYKRASLK